MPKHLPPRPGQPGEVPRTHIREELAWAAGLFDGEGYTGMIERTVPSSGRRIPRLNMALSQWHDPEAVERFMAAVGTGKICPRQRNNGKVSEWIWYAVGLEQVQATTMILWPWLSRPKRRQALQAITSFHHRRAEIGIRSRKHIRKVPDPRLLPELTPAHPPRNEELAWAAGLFDGEGFIGTYKRKGANRRIHTLRISVSQFHDPEVIERFITIIGCGQISNRPRNNGTVTEWVWYTQGLERVQTSVIALWPWLSRPKRSQALFSLEAYLGHRPIVPIRDWRQTQHA